MNADKPDNVQAALKALAQDMEANEQARPEIEVSLRGAFRRHRALRAWRKRIVLGALAASLVFLLVSVERTLRRAPAPAEPVAEMSLPAPVVEPAPEPASPAVSANRPARVVPEARPAPRRARIARPRVSTGFLPVVGGYFVEPLDRGHLVRVQLPRSALRTFGLPMNEDRAFESVEADVLIGEDGVARAIRFVQ